MRKIDSNRDFVYDHPRNGGFSEKLFSLASDIGALFYKIRMNLIRVNVEEKKYNVAVCAIFKNEAPYLKEWIEYNHLVGIEHFYMYNNNSEDDYEGILNPYIEKGLVTLVQWPHNQAQMQCYKNCIEKYSQETKWLGFIDIDEFIVPKDKDNIYDILKNFEKNRGSVKLYWRMYGTSARLNRNLNGLVTEDFTVCWDKYYEVGKCFYNTAFSFDYETKKNDGLHHYFWANYKGMNLPPVNIFDRVCFGLHNSIPNRKMPVQLNHYFTKSVEEYAMKKSKGDVYFVENPHDEEYFYHHEMYCTSTDYSAYKYLVKLKLLVKKD